MELNITMKEQYVLESIHSVGNKFINYEIMKSNGLSLKPKSYVGVMNSLKKKGLLNVDGIGIKANVSLV